MRKYFIALFLFLSANAFATDTYNPTNNMLNLDAVILNGVQYNNVVVQLLGYNVISVGSSQIVQTSTGSSNTITLAQLNACPNTNGSSAAQFWSCFSGTLVGVETNQNYPCTLTIGNGNISMSTTDQNLSIGGTFSNASYSKSISLSGTSVGPNVNIRSDNGDGLFQFYDLISGSNVGAAISTGISTGKNIKSLGCSFVLS